MRKKERYEKVIAWFQENVPVAETELHYNNPYEQIGRASCRERV